MGIHALFEQSDQNHYLHKCERCNHWNQLSYDDFDPSSKYSGGNVLTVNPDGIDVLAKTVVPGSFQYVCQACGKPLDRFYNGEWIAKHPSRAKGDNGIKGYFISQMNAVWKNLDEIKSRELNSRSKQAFYNYTLGMPFLDEKLAVTESDVLDHYHNHEGPVPNREGYEFVSVGIDWGKIISVAPLYSNI